VNEHEATEDREADRTGRVPAEGTVSEEGGRPKTSGRPPDRLRLKRSVDCFVDDRNDVQLIRDGLEEQYAIDRPEAQDLRTLELLRSGFLTEEEIADSLRNDDRTADSLPGSLRALDKIGVLERDRGRDVLTPEESERFDRQLIYLADIAPAGQSAWHLQQRLLQSRVTVLGCGGLGSWAATGLTLAGVGQLTLVDDDTVELSNLNRQLLFRKSDIGRRKVEVAQESLTAINPELDVTIVSRRVQTEAELTRLVMDTDFLVMTADQPPYELARMVNRACLSMGTPWISAGQIPPLIRVGPTVIPGQTPCHDCQEAGFRRNYPLYEALVEHRCQNPTDVATLGAASGTIGSLIAMEVTHHLSGALKPATLGRTMIMDLRTLQVEFEPVDSDPECECRETRRGVGISRTG
jgi:bacteriocin biosynthesis cyclodehydratase domain-containing protein